MTISIGIVGCGSFAQSFIPLFQHHPLVHRLALCDINSSRLADNARKYQVQETYADFETICRSDLDALVIMTQPWLHAPQAIQALDSGKCVYSAVPVISLPSGDEMLQWCDRLIEAVCRSGRHYMMGETSYYRCEAMYGRRMAAQGAFGHFVHAQGSYLHDVDSPCSLREVCMRRHGDEWNLSLSGNTPMHYPTHSTGGLRSVMNAHVTKISALGHIIPGDDWHRPDTVHRNPFGNEVALCRMSNGATAEIREFRKVGHIGFENFSIYGTEASLVSVPPEDSAALWTTRSSITPLTSEDMRDVLPEDVMAAFNQAMPHNPYGGHGGSHAFMVHEFVEAVQQDRLPAIHAWAAVRYLAPGIMAHKSAMRDGELLDVPDWGDPPQR